MERCKKEKHEGKEKCNNGPNCQYHKENRCNYAHDKTGEEAWTKVQYKRQPKQPSHNKQQPKEHHQQRLHQKTPNHERSKDECRNEPSCIFLKHNKCNFVHKQPRQGRQGSNKQISSGAQKQGGP